MRHRTNPLHLAAALALIWPLSASAHNWPYGFVWAYDPASPSYSPVGPYFYSDVGAAPRIERTETGKYSVSFPGLAGIDTLEANVQVTAYGLGSDYCKAQGWSGDAITVICFDTAGNAADTYFSLLYIEQDPDAHADATPSDVGRYAFALADQPANPSYAPDPAYASNPAGGAITATRSGTGAYSIAFAGMSAIGAGGGHVQVTAHGPGSARCRVQSWSSESAAVRCYGASGAPADSAYSILFWRTDSDDPGLAFAWADQKSSASYTPSAAYSYNAGGGTITAVRNSTGHYAVVWSGMQDIGVNGGNVQVTAYGGSVDVRCKVDFWYPGQANVLCHDAAGNPIDSAYTVLFLKTPKKPWLKEYAFAYAHDASAPLGYDYHPLYDASYNAPGGYDLGSAPPGLRTDIEISRSGTGIYNVHFEGFRAYAGGGNAQVKVFASSNDYCNVERWEPEDVHVRCFDAAGIPSNALFDVLYLKAPTQNTSLAYAWADLPGAASYTPRSSYSHNPAGDAITATRAGPGLYTMTWSSFGALAPGGGHPQVTAYGAGNRRCQIQSWSGDSVHVRCFDSAGNLADSAYSVLYVRPDAKDDGLAFAWADQPLAPAPYTPSPIYSFNAGNAVGGLSDGVGEDSVVFAELEWRGFGYALTLASGYGSSDNRCHHSWMGVEYGITTCYDAAGSPVDAKIDVLHVRPVAVPEPGHVSLLAAGGTLLTLLARRRAPLLL